VAATRTLSAELQASSGSRKKPVPYPKPPVAPKPATPVKPIGLNGRTNVTSKPGAIRLKTSVSMGAESSHSTQLGTVGLHASNRGPALQKSYVKTSKVLDHSSYPKFEEPLYEEALCYRPATKVSQIIENLYDDTVQKKSANSAFQTKPGPVINTPFKNFTAVEHEDPIYDEAAPVCKDLLTESIKDVQRVNGGNKMSKLKALPVPPSKQYEEDDNEPALYEDALAVCPQQIETIENRSSCFRQPPVVTNNFSVENDSSPIFEDETAIHAMHKSRKSTSSKSSEKPRVPVMPSTKASTVLNSWMAKNSSSTDEGRPPVNLTADEEENLYEQALPVVSRKSSSDHKTVPIPTITDNETLPEYSLYDEAATVKKENLSFKKQISNASGASKSQISSPADMSTIDEDSPEEDDSLPIYFNLLLLKKSIVARASIRSVTSSNARRAHESLENKARRLSNFNSSRLNGPNGMEYVLLIIRVRSDKDRTGTITIVPVRTGTVILEKYRKF